MVDGWANAVTGDTNQVNGDRNIVTTLEANDLPGM